MKPLGSLVSAATSAGCRLWFRRWVVAWILLTSWMSKPVVAGEPDDRLEPDDPTPPNVESPTFGGWQLWGDELVFHGWRIQRWQQQRLGGRGGQQRRRQRGRCFSRQQQWGSDWRR